MATSTLGSNANNSLPFALQVHGSFTNQAGVKFASIVAQADLATVNQAILDDQNRNLPAPGAGNWGFSNTQRLYIPNRGFLQCLPGDWVAVDSRGWPILLSADTIANGLWTHVP